MPKGCRTSQGLHGLVRWEGDWPLRVAIRIFASKRGSVLNRTSLAMCIKGRSESEELFPQFPRALDGGCLASFSSGLAVGQQGRPVSTQGWPVPSSQPAEACASCLGVAGLETANLDFLPLSLNLQHFVCRVALCLLLVCCCHSLPRSWCTKCCWDLEGPSTVGPRISQIAAPLRNQLSSSVSSGSLTSQRPLPKA